MTFRLKHLSIAGFRGFGDGAAIELDADVVIISGVNGSGKTSLMDSILWVLTGAIPRLGNDPEILSRYSTSGEALVELVLQDEHGSSLRVVRRYDGEAASLALQMDDAVTTRGPAAEGNLLQALWPDAQLAQDPWDALSRSLTRAVYLQQDSVRDFVEADGEEERFRAVGEIVGAGRAAELSNQLASARTRWSRASNALEQEVGPLRARLAQLRSRVESLDSTGSDTEKLNDDWQQWREHSMELLGTATESADRAAYLDRTLSAMQAEEGRLQRAIDVLSELQSALQDPVQEPSAMAEVDLALHASEVALEDASSTLASVRAAAAEQRRRALEVAEVDERLATMAAIALEHLDDSCPVCGQEHDVPTTRARLGEYLDRPGLPEAATSGDDVATAAAEVERLVQEVSRFAERRREIQMEADRHARWSAHVSRLAEEAGVPGESLGLVEVGSRLDENAATAERVASLRYSGERLGLSLARLEELGQRHSLEAQIRELEDQLRRQEGELAARTETTEVANQLLDGLRTASEDLVKVELARMEPLLQRIYSSVDPHPSFRAVNFLTRTVRGKGRLWTPIADIDADQSVNEPSSVLSSSQLNVLAVSTFLALNLSVDTLPLGIVSLDDPLQSLDDVNLLGLADLIRRIRARRQVIISTHDDRLSGLLRRKLRPVKVGERTLTVELGGWSRKGPTVEVSQVPPDLSSLRLVG